MELLEINSDVPDTWNVTTLEPLKQDLFEPMYNKMVKILDTKIREKRPFLVRFTDTELRTIAGSFRTFMVIPEEHEAFLKALVSPIGYIFALPLRNHYHEQNIWPKIIGNYPDEVNPNGTSRLAIEFFVE